MSNSQFFNHVRNKYLIGGGMAVLFFIFAMALVLMGLGLRRAALILLVINLLFCLAMFLHHVTDKLNIML